MERGAKNRDAGKKAVGGGRAGHGGKKAAGGGGAGHGGKVKPGNIVMAGALAASMALLLSMSGMPGMPGITGSGTGVGTGAGVGSGAGVGISVGMDIDANVGIGAGMEVAIELDEMPVPLGEAAAPDGLGEAPAPEESDYADGEDVAPDWLGEAPAPDDVLDEDTGDAFDDPDAAPGDDPDAAPGGDPDAAPGGDVYDDPDMAMGDGAVAYYGADMSDEQDGVDVTVSMEVKGDFADKTKAFEFIVEFTSSDEYGRVTADIGYVGGTLPKSAAEAPDGGEINIRNGKIGKEVFFLSHGQTVTFADVPYDAAIKVKGTPNIHYGTSWDSEYPAAEAELGNEAVASPVGDDDLWFHFINEVKEVVPTGIGGGSRSSEMLPLIVASATLLSLMAIAIIKRNVVR